MPRTPRMSTFEFHVIFVCCGIPSFDFCPRLFKNVKSILSTLVLQKQVVDWIWPVGHSGPPSGCRSWYGRHGPFSFQVLSTSSTVPPVGRLYLHSSVLWDLGQAAALSQHGAGRISAF